MSGKPKFSLAAFLFLCSSRRFCLPSLVVKPTHLDKLTTGRALLLRGTKMTKMYGCIPLSVLVNLTKRFFFLICPWLHCEILICWDQNSIYAFPHMQNSVGNRLIRITPTMQRWKCWFGVTKGEGCQLRQLQICTFWSTSVSAASHISGSTTPVLKWRRKKWSHSAGMTPKEKNFRIWDHVWQQFWGITFSGKELYPNDSNFKIII